MKKTDRIELRRRRRELNLSGRRSNIFDRKFRRHSVALQYREPEVIHARTIPRPRPRTGPLSALEMVAALCRIFSPW